MTRDMYDCIGGAAGWVRANLPLPSLMAYYGTGTSAVQWTESERTLFPASILVEIDQGATGSPIPTATVRDVERGAWAPGQAVDIAGWDVERPTIYVSRGELGSILSDGWQGDLWLAWPGWRGEPLPSAPGCTYVAVQDKFGQQYDHSTVLDPYWPHVKGPAQVTTQVNVTDTARVVDIEFAEVAGAEHYVVQYQQDASAAKALLTRAPAYGASDRVYLGGVVVPGTSGGTIIVNAIIGGNPEIIGSHTL